MSITQGIPPNAEEYAIVVDFMMDTGTLVGSPHEIWTHRSAWFALRTMRHAIRGLDHLCRIGKAVGITRVKVAMTAIALEDDEESPWMADEIVKHLLEDARARAYWDGLMPTGRYPHKCPRCGYAAYVGFLRVDCKKCGDF